MGRGRGDYSLRKVMIIGKGDNVNRSTINNNFIEHKQRKREPSASSGAKETGKIQTSFGICRSQLSNHAFGMSKLHFSLY